MFILTLKANAQNTFSLTDLTFPCIWENYEYLKAYVYFFWVMSNGFFLLRSKGVSLGFLESMNVKFTQRLARRHR